MFKLLFMPYQGISLKFPFILFLKISLIYAININIPAVFVYVTGALGITAGAHRLWAHRAYKAKLSYRILVMIMNCTAFQWTDTHADPHNTNRGFFFAHMGWLMVKKHPQVRSSIIGSLCLSIL
uniref:Stearoyl-CoA desaturase 5 n=1 Tax=Heterorhabditis bacteriophora TaxID=37862 RepID=A0A1I7WI59_HETBA